MKRLNSKKMYFFVIVLILLFSLFALTQGSVKIKLSDIGKLFYDIENVPPYIKTIVFNIRLPRIIMSILIGMLLASSGTVVQAVYQNPLADPYIIGISSSATLGAVLAYMLKLPDFMFGIFGFFSSVIVSLFIFKISRLKKNSDITTLLIVGIAISAFLSSFTSFGMYMIGQDSFRIVAWMMGYLGSASWIKVSILLVPLVVSLIYFYLKRYEMDLLLSGNEEAHSMGLNVNIVKKNLLVVTSLVVGYSVAFSGLIGFVGLIAPHTIRMIIKSGSNKRLLPIATLFGGFFLLICDTIGRLILAPTEIPIGVITSFIGAPFFLYLAFNRKK